MIQLMHHYTLYTAPTFCDCPFLLPLWQSAIPLLAFDNPFLLHNVAALSSMHLAHLSYLSPTTATESASHVQAALYHQDAALKLIRSRINDINPKTASAVFICAFFVSIFDIASHSPHLTPLFTGPRKLPAPKHLNQTSNSNADKFCNSCLVTQNCTCAVFLGLESNNNYNNTDIDKNNNIINQIQTIFHLLRGVLTIIEIFEPTIRTGPVAPLIRSISPDTTRPAPTDIEHALDQLEALCAKSHADAPPGPLAPAVADLRIAFRKVCSVAAPPVSAVFEWACVVDDSFLTALRAGDERALVILGLYGVLLHALDGIWWTSGWGRALVGAVEPVVAGVEARGLMAWARNKVGCDGGVGRR